MSKAATQVWALDDFLRWEAEQERRYELVGGEARLMTGGSQAHSFIAGNILSVLRALLRGSPCRPFGSGLRIPIPAMGHSRYPDVTVDGGPFAETSHDASEPAVVFEVLSKSTAWYDQTQKLRDYETVHSIQHYVCVSQSELRVSLWSRGEDGRFVASEDLVDLDGALALITLGLSLSLREIYEGMGLIDTAGSQS